MDNILLNNGLLWNSGQGIGGGGATSGTFVFNGYSLDNGTTRRVTYSDHDNLTGVAYSTYNYPRDNGGNALARYYRTRVITIKISVSGASAEALNDTIDEIKQATSKVQGNLDITVNGVIRRWQATVTSINFNRQAHNVDFIKDVTIAFSCVNPIAFSVNAVSNTFSNVSGTLQTEVAYNGVVATYPTVYLILDQALTAQNLTLTVNGYAIKANYNFNNWDVVIFDGEAKLLKVNGTPITYVGTFPVLENWANVINVTFNSSALVNYTAVVIYNNKYL